MNSKRTGLAHIKGVVESIIFSKTDDNFFIFSIIVEDIAQQKNDAFDLTGIESVIVKGVASSLSVGEKVVVKGEWIFHAEYGNQIKATLIENLSWREVIEGNPSKEGAISFLSSGVIEGVGKVLARKIVEALGPDAINIINKEQNSLTKIKNLRNPDKIRAQVRLYYCQAVLHALLAPYGINPKMLGRVYNFFGSDAYLIVKNNPYELCKIDGIGFEKADKYAKNAGIKHDSLQRIREGVKFALHETVMSFGSCGIEEGHLILASKEILTVPEDLVCQVINDLRVSNEIKFEDGYYFDAAAYHAENEIARHIARLMGKTTFSGLTLYNAIIKAEKIVNVTLSIEQREAVVMAIENRFSIITGQPGTGKTTIVAVIITALNILGISSDCIAVVAPTGKAGKRLEESCGKGSTIHRALGAQGVGKFTFNEKNQLVEDAAFADEFSMCDIFLTVNLFSAIATGTIVLIVGDNDQLRSVGPGQVLGDMIASDLIPTKKLTEIRRFDGDIALAAKMVNEGNVPYVISGQKDFFMIGVTNNNAMNALAKTVIRMLEKDTSADEIQVMVPMKTGVVSVKSANDILQPILNKKATSTAPFVERFGTKYYVGDRVMQLRNDYENNIFNGDVGKVSLIQGGNVVVQYSSAEVSYNPSALDDLTLSYAATIHKMQGSEAENIIVLMMTSHYRMLKRNLLYTGMTRAKKLLVVMTDAMVNGTYPALEKAVSVVDSELRITRLCVLLSKLTKE